MRPHMLVQYPLLMLAGALIGSVVPASAARPIARFNGLGISGLSLAAAVLAVAMIPRVLDLALVDTRVEALKFVALVAAGAVAPASWRAAGPVVQAFLLGSVLPMTVAAGSAYIDAPVRLCNAYRLDEQQRLGVELIVIAAVCGVAWVTLTMYRYGAGGEARVPPTPPAGTVPPRRRSRRSSPARP
jgi:drug/metabolite transporter (DMT)-like permease